MTAWQPETAIRDALPDDGEEAARVVVRSIIELCDDRAKVGVAAMTSEGVVTLNYVLPSHRLRGISKALISRLEVKAADRGLHTMSLESTQTALRLYKSVGFDETAAPTRGYGISLAYPMAKRVLV